MHRRLLSCLAFGLSCLVVVCRSAVAEGERASNVLPITRAQAANILANRDSIAESLDKQISRIDDPRLAVVLQDVRAAATDPSEWRWYSRDRGILLAISVRERLGIAEHVEGARELADIVRKLINQNGWGNPTVQVVLIEPETPIIGGGSSAACTAVAPVITCECW